jgi:poly-gamma-glutamate system protein
MLGDVHVKTEYYDAQIDAATRMRRCIDTLSMADISPIQDFDPNETNLIGVEYSQITTTIGDLIAKRTSTNPDFSALIVRYLNGIGVKRGDAIAIGCSGSFPALAIAAICACEIMGLEARIIASVAASGYGANRPALTYLDMEKYLFDKGCLSSRTIAASFGGADDVATDLQPGGLNILKRTIKKHGLIFINEPDREENIMLREQLYQKGGQPVVFINIGGGVMNIGSYDEARELAPGINQGRYFGTSMSARYLNKGIPVIHLLNIERLAHQNGLAIDPVPLPGPGMSDVYFDVRLRNTSIFVSFPFFLLGFCVLLQIIPSCSRITRTMSS